MTGERCQKCGRGYDTVYRVPDGIWRTISPKGSEGGLLCLPCCLEAAAEFDLYWEAVAAKFPSESPRRGR